MNVISKSDYLKSLDNTHNVELNKKLIASFPFLLPKNVWTGKISDEYDYSYTLLSDLLYGWAKAFGYEMLCEIREALIEANYLDQYFITQIKEKYGTLRWYDFGAPQKVHEIIDKYENKSSCVCSICGDIATHMTIGWITYLCSNCAKKNNIIVIPKD